MTTYIGLLKWTDQGVRSFRETLERYEDAQKLAGQFGLEMTAVYWTPGGPYDIVSVIKGGDPDKFAAFSLLIESMGNLRIEATQAYGPEEMRQVVSNASI
ncbi:GYD domain-containing protein [Allosalinactinospora lopnorensis]|uniref:GYD domain-containing protein n=1 Tax=Allosalinactinospora lopnorensis TaxID=1352348 RepID=UPI000623C1B5|nr:GYD domain-containing protein [Allosalinactinospora lopnorensis]